MPRLILRLLVALYFISSASAHASGVEVFAKGSASKNYLSTDSYQLSLSLSTGIAIALFKQIRLEARYTNNSSLQNQLQVASNGVSAILNDIKTQTVIYSLGLDIDFVDEKYWFQPFLFVGAGYMETDRSYYVRPDMNTAATYQPDPKQTGVSGNLGLGFRLRILRALAFEVEAFAYGIDIHKPNPLINLYGTIGLRVFL